MSDEHRTPPIKVLILDDEMTEESEEYARLTALLDHQAPKGHTCLYKLAHHWDELNKPVKGLDLVKENLYRLIVLDMVFDKQNTSGLRIYESIRCGLDNHPGHEGTMKTSRAVGIVVFTGYPGRPDAASQVEAIAATGDKYHVQLSKVVLPGEVPASVLDKLRYLLKRDPDNVALHLRFPDHESQLQSIENMELAFSYQGELPCEYIKNHDRAYRVLCRALQWESGKQRWRFYMRDPSGGPIAMCTVRLRKLYQAFTKSKVHFIARDRTKARDSGYYLLQGVTEIHLHFDNPTLFGLSKDTLILSSTSEPRFVDPEIWGPLPDYEQQPEPDKSEPATAGPRR